MLVKVKFPPTDELCSTRAPELEISAVPGLPVLTVSVPAAVSIGVAPEPMLPVPVVNCTVPVVVNVTAPDLVIVPEPSAERAISPAVPVVILALMTILAELPEVVVRLAVEPLPVRFIPPRTLSVPKALTKTEPVVPATGPSVVAPAVTVRFLAPNVIV